MDRRTYLTGLGTLAAVTATPIATGAFGSGEPLEGDVIVGTDAEVELVPLESGEGYATFEDGRLSLSVGDGTRGLNPGATFWIDGLFALCNRSETPAEVSVEPPADDDFSAGVDAATDGGEPRVLPYVGDRAGPAVGDEGVRLDGGDCVEVGLRVDTRGVGSGTLFDGGLEFHVEDVEG